MRTISKWAHRNPIKSRFLIALLHLLSMANALFLGILLFRQDWPSSPIPTLLLSAAFFTAFLLYPQAKARLTNKKYRRQKICDFTLVLSGTLFLAFSVNNYLAVPSGNSAGLAENTLPVVQLSALGQANTAEVLVPPTKAEIRKARRRQLKELKASIKAWKKEHKGDRKTSKFGQVMLIVLVVMGAGLAALGVAALACSLACSGAEGLGILLLLSGFGGILFLSFLLIRGIVGSGGPPARPVT